MILINNYLDSKKSSQIYFNIRAAVFSLIKIASLCGVNCKPFGKNKLSNKVSTKPVEVSNLNKRPRPRASTCSSRAPSTPLISLVSKKYIIFPSISKSLRNLGLDAPNRLSFDEIISFLVPFSFSNY